MKVHPGASVVLDLPILWETVKFQRMYTLFDKILRSGLCTQSFLAFCDFEYSNFLDSFSTFFSKIEQQTKENTGL